MTESGHSRRRSGGLKRSAMVVVACLSASCALAPVEPDATLAGAPVYRIIQPARAITPELAMARLELGRGEYREARRRFDALLEVDPEDVKALSGSALANWALGARARALEQWRDAARLAPDDAAAQHALGFALFDSGQTAAAWQVLRRAYAIDPGHPGTRARLRALAPSLHAGCTDPQTCRGTIGPPSTVPDSEPVADAHDSSHDRRPYRTADPQDTLH